MGEVGMVHEVGKKEHAACECSQSCLVAGIEYGQRREDDEAPAAQGQEVDPGIEKPWPALGRTGWRGSGYARAPRPIRPAKSSLPEHSSGADRGGIPGGAGLACFVHPLLSAPWKLRETLLPNRDRWSGECQDSPPTVLAHRKRRPLARTTLGVHVFAGSLRCAMDEAECLSSPRPPNRADSSWAAGSAFTGATSSILPPEPRPRYRTSVRPSMNRSGSGRSIARPEGGRCALRRGRYCP